jgi:hypothetical protein
VYLPLFVEKAFSLSGLLKNIFWGLALLERDGVYRQVGRKHNLRQKILMLPSTIGLDPNKFFSDMVHSAKHEAAHYIVNYFADPAAREMVKSMSIKNGPSKPGHFLGQSPDNYLKWYQPLPLEGEFVSNRHKDSRNLKMALVGLVYETCFVDRKGSRFQRKKMEDVLLAYFSIHKSDEISPTTLLFEDRSIWASVPLFRSIQPQKSFFNALFESTYTYLYGVDFKEQRVDNATYRFRIGKAGIRALCDIGLEVFNLLKKHEKVWIHVEWELRNNVELDEAAMRNLDEEVRRLIESQNPRAGC